MRVVRHYQPKEVNWLLLPDLLAKISAEIPDSEKREGEKCDILYVVPGFRISTFSQRIVLDSPEDFVDFVKSTPEPLEATEVLLECFRKPGTLRPYDLPPPYFRFSSKALRIEVEVARTTTNSAMSTLEEIEGKLQLEPAKPPQESQGKEAEEERHLPRTVFVAHAFDEGGRSYAFQLTKFLNLLGFQVVTGEGFSPQSVSAKVKRRLTAQEFVVAILSRNEDLTWLTQEMTAADVSGKPIFLLGA